jgi:hypothetical protein
MNKQEKQAHRKQLQQLRNSFIVLTLLPVIADHMEDMLPELPNGSKLYLVTENLINIFRENDEAFINNDLKVLDQQVRIQTAFRKWIGNNFII